MKEKLSADILRNRQVNYIIIEKMWEYFNKGKDKQSLYKLLGITKNMYSRIRTADTYNTPNLDARWEYKNSDLHKLGLPKEIMTGSEQIQIEDITKEEWEKYLEFRYKNTETSYERTSFMQSHNKKLKNAFDKLKADKRDKRDIAMLFYYFKYGRAAYLDLDLDDAEMQDLKDSLKHVSIENIKVCDKKLRKEIYDLLKEKYRQFDIILKYEGLEGLNG